MNDIVIAVSQDASGKEIATRLPESIVTMPQKAMTLAKPDDFIHPSESCYPWGANNRRPTEMRLKLEEVPLAMAAINKLVKLLYGDGIVYHLNSDISKGGDVPRASVPEVEEFMKRCHINTKWFLAQAWDMQIYGNTFSEMIMSRDKTKIVEIWHKSAEHCRLTPVNKSNKVEYMKYSPMYVDGDPMERDISAFYLMRWYEKDAFLAELRGTKFAWHTYIPSPGMTYYANPPWIGLFKECGWLDVAANVPRIISAMQNNQITLKYQIKISIQYFRSRYPDWDTYTALQREKHIDEKVAKINTFLSGTENQFKSWVDVFEEDMVTHELYGDVKIIAVDDKTKSGTWVPDSTTADDQIVKALGLHQSLLGGNAVDGKIGAGSGADQRESFNTAIGTNTLDQTVILEPLNYISEYNKWGVTFSIAHTHHTTTNDRENGLVPPSDMPKLG